MNITQPDITKALDEMSECLIDSLSASNRPDPVMIGIHTGGAWVAEALRQRINPEMPFGTLDISFYRDDFTRIGMNPQVKPSNIPFDIDDRHIILVDDVLYSGRTIRAALNELFDYGRPASVNLAVLVERDGRQLPIAAACTGMHVNLENGQQIKLSGPDPLLLEIIQTS
jgi:pyrimidine operon attenuation protein/uracil phosphoribosyltransferase